MEVDELLEAYERMYLIRRFEQLASRLYASGDIPGFVHLCIGQEATAVGACSPLTISDYVTSTHRGHGHCLAKGLDPEPMFAELFARETGVCRGRGGSMHIADPSLGILGANGIVGAGLPIGVGAGLAAKQAGQGQVVVAMFGDGAVAQGAFHEAVNLASVWRLPVIFFCENNHYAEFSPEASQHPATLGARAQGYGMPHHSVDGNDVVAVATLMEEVVARARAGGGPAIVEADTYRWHGHYEGDPERYRSPEEVTQARSRDPLTVTHQQLRDLGLDQPALEACHERVDARLEKAIASARGSAMPAVETLLDHVHAARPPMVEPSPADGPDFRYMDAVRLALQHELELDETVVVAGVDVGVGGNVFGITRGLAERFPDRVFDTPISETAVMGLAVGGSMAGLRPVVELMYLDFIGVCFDQVLNQAAKLRYMTGGRAELPLVVRTQFGAGRSSGSQHSQSLEALLAHIPGLTVVMPATPADAYGLLRSAIRDPNPVIFIENRLLYGMKGPSPVGDHLIPLGRAAVVRPGSDVTVVSMSRCIHDVLAAVVELADEGIDAEVIDLRTIAPLDMETIIASVTKTARLVIVHEAVRDFGVGAEIAARAAEECFWDLDAPIARLGGPRSPIPYAPNLEQAWLPGVEDIMTIVRDTARA